MVNNVVLVGRLTRDPELRKTSTGMGVASFTIACDDSRKGPNGEKVTIFMNVSVFGNSADTVVKFTRKGSLVGVVGRLTQRKYTRRKTAEAPAETGAKPKRKYTRRKTAEVSAEPEEKPKRKSTRRKKTEPTEENQ